VSGVECRVSSSSSSSISRFEDDDEDDDEDERLALPRLLRARTDRRQFKELREGPSLAGLLLRWSGSVDDYGDDYGGRIRNFPRYP
jgi:hypothetical protein